MIKNTESDKRILLKKICDYCGYKLKIYEKESADDSVKYVADNGTTNGLTFKGIDRRTKQNGYLHLEYRNIDFALKDWLKILIFINDESPETPYSVWSKEIIDFISQLEVTYHVDIRETLVKGVDITTTSIEEAKRQVKEKYDNEEIVLSADDFSGGVDVRTYDQDCNPLEDWDENYIGY